MTSQAFHLTIQGSYQLKHKIKTIRGSLEAAFELKKVFRYTSYGFKIIEKKSNIYSAKKGKEPPSG